jgi:hypothetical protein
LSELKLSKANLAIDEYLIPIDDLKVVAQYADGKVDVHELLMSALHGELNVTAAIALDESLTTDARLHVSEMILQDTLRAGASETEPPKYSGRVNAEVEFEAAPVLTIARRIIEALPSATQPTTGPTTSPTTSPTTDEAVSAAPPSGTQPSTLPAIETVEAGEESPVAADDPQPVTQPVEMTMDAEPTTQQMAAVAALHGELPARWGHGWISIDEGRLVAVPLVQRFSNAVAKMNKADLTKPNERARLEFEFGGRYMTLTQIHYVSNVAVARGKGTISLERDLDLTLNGGPLEKLESVLGGLGAAIGKATDAMSGYRVTGKIADPKVEMELGKITVNDAAQKTGGAIGKGAKATTQGIGTAGKTVGGFLNKVLKKK